MRLLSAMTNLDLPYIKISPCKRIAFLLMCKEFNIPVHVEIADSDRLIEKLPPVLNGLVGDCLWEYDDMLVEFYGFTGHTYVRDITVCVPLSKPKSPALPAWLDAGPSLKCAILLMLFEQRQLLSLDYDSPGLNKIFHVKGQIEYFYGGGANAFIAHIQDNNVYSNRIRSLEVIK